MKARFSYLLIVISIIILGILSRKISIIPLWIGDSLYGMIIYFMIRTTFPNQPKIKSSIISILICYLVEFSQLYQVNWLNEIRHTLLGRYILGQGFLWSDIIAYTFGVFVAYLLDNFTKTNTSE